MSQVIPNPPSQFGWQSRIPGVIDDFRGGLRGGPKQWDLFNKAGQTSDRFGNWLHQRLGAEKAANLSGYLDDVGRRALQFGNKVNDALLKTNKGIFGGGPNMGLGVKGGFKTVGGMMSALPLRSIARSYVHGTLMMGAIEMGFMGKSMSLGTIADAAWESIPMTLGFELAGNSLIKGMGWQMLGGAMGMGAWGSLGLQVLGTAFVPGLGWGLAGAAAGYYAGKGLYNMGKSLYESGRQVHQTNFETGDMSFQLANAATMRSRSLAAIQKSHMNMRQLLGNEASFLMGRG